jgi:serine/threonine-protein kinase
MADTLSPDGEPSLEADGKVGTVLGSYRLVKLLGEGGMGRVYLAEHTRLGRRVALKLLRPEYAMNPSAVKRFFGEARSVNQINHEHIVEITDFIEDEGTEKYYIMELLNGSDLGDLQTAGVLSMERTLNIAKQVADALAAVHDAGIVHRDLKPDNIYLIERAGQADWVKLLDFGVAKLMDSDGNSLGQTKTGAIIGTPLYMSPEQVGGKPVDYRTDIYAFGVILYEMASGRKPFGAKNVGELVIKHLTEPPPDLLSLKGVPHQIPRDLAYLIHQCLEKEAEKRPQSMREIHQRLSDMMEGKPSSAPRPRPARSGSRRGLVIGMVSLGVAGLLGAVGFVAFKNMGAEPVAQATPAPKPVARKKAPRPRKIELTFDSVPPGAEVFKQGQDDPLGITPVTVKLEQGNDSRTFELRMPGYKTVKKSVSLKESTRLLVSLSEVPKPKPDKKQLADRIKKRGPFRTRGRSLKDVKRNNVEAEASKVVDKAKKKATKYDKGGVLDPFADL